MKQKLLSLILVMIMIILPACNKKNSQAEEYKEEGITYFKSYDYDKASKSFETVLKIEPDKIENYNNLIKSLIRESQLNIKNRKIFNQMALETARKATSIKPDSANTLCNLGDVYSLMGEYDKAIDSYKKAIELNNDFDQEPETDYTEFSLINTLSDAYVGLAFTYGAINKIDLAEEYYDKAIKLDPQDPYNYYNLARTMFKNNLYHKAIENYKKAISLLDNDPGMYNDLALAYSEERRYDLAEANLTKAIELNKDYVDPYYHLGIVYILTNKNDKAKIMFSKVLELEPSYTDAARKLKALEEGKQLKDPEDNKKIHKPEKTTPEQH